MILYLRPSSSLQDIVRLSNIYNFFTKLTNTVSNCQIRTIPQTFIVIPIQDSINVFFTWHVSFPAMASDHLSMKIYLRENTIYLFLCEVFSGRIYALENASHITCDQSYKIYSDCKRVNNANYRRFLAAIFSVFPCSIYHSNVTSWYYILFKQCH